MMQNLITATAAFLPGLLVGLRFAHHDLIAMRREMSLQIGELRTESAVAREHAQQGIDRVNERVDHVIELMRCA